MNTRIIKGDALTSVEVHQGIFSYEIDGKTIDINGELYYNKEKEQFEHWHDDETLVVWSYKF